MKLHLYSLVLAAAALQAVPSAAAGPSGDFHAASASIGDEGALRPEHLLEGYGCHGANLSPEVHWSNAPVGTRSFAVTVQDVDAPTDSGWWHWTVLDIPADWSRIPKGLSTSPGAGGLVQLRSDFGSAGWGGPCPPQGGQPHRYVFKVYALPVARLGLNADATPAMASYLLRAQALAVRQFVATSRR